MISAIVLAAGSSTRMGAKNKLMLQYKGRTFIETVVDELLASNIDKVVVVLGHEKEKIKPLLAGKNVTITFNDKYDEGMTSSIQAGINAMNIENLPTGYLICLSDMPFLTTTDYNHIIESISGDKEILLPFYQNQKGNPVFFSKDFKRELLDHKEPEGCREVVAISKKFIRKVLFDNDHILRDVDTTDDFLRIGGESNRTT